MFEFSIIESFEMNCQFYIVRQENSRCFVRWYSDILRIHQRKRFSLVYIGYNKKENYYLKLQHLMLKSLERNILDFTKIFYNQVIGSSAITDIVEISSITRK